MEIKPAWLLEGSLIFSPRGHPHTDTGLHRQLLHITISPLTSNNSQRVREKCPRRSEVQANKGRDTDPETRSSRTVQPHPMGCPRYFFAFCLHVFPLETTSTLTVINENIV